MTRFPQVLVNIRVQNKQALNGHPVIAEAVRLAEQKLAGRGRILVRPSGTEPLVRVMGEGPREDELLEVSICPVGGGQGRVGVSILEF